VFLAFASDFAHFRTWESFDCGEGVAPGDDHLTGTRRVYFNRRPPPGSRVFPVGTIFVKESGEGALPSRHVFAMVKRGGGFNAGGAGDWEWFGLQNDPSGAVTIAWRGTGPATGDAYGSASTGGCNTCHGGAWRDDYAFSPTLTSMLGP
jgi:hypothetical protein